MKSTKRLYALALAAVLLFAACSEKPEQAETSENPVSNPSVSAEPEAEAASNSGSEALIAMEEDYDWKAGVKKNDYNGYEFIWQLKGHLKNEYRTIQASSQN